MSTTRHIASLLLLAMCAGMTRAATNDVAQLSPQMAYFARIAEAAEEVPTLKSEKGNVWQAWGVFAPDLCKRAESGEMPTESWPTNDFKHVEGYEQPFTIGDTMKGNITYGTFATPEEAHAAFVYATTTTAAPWYSDPALAKEITPKPDEVLFAERHACIIRQGTTCVRVGMCVGDEDARMKHVIEIINRILAEMDAAGTNN